MKKGEKVKMKFVSVILVMLVIILGLGTYVYVFKDKEPTHGVFVYDDGQDKGEGVLSGYLYSPS